MTIRLANLRRLIPRTVPQRSSHVLIEFSLPAIVWRQTRPERALRGVTRSRERHRLALRGLFRALGDAMLWRHQKWLKTEIAFTA
jgi:hypothetical protein